MKASAKRPSANKPSNRNARRAMRPGGYRRGAVISGPRDGRPYWRGAHEDEFLAALEWAGQSGTLGEWTIGQLVGKWPPPESARNAIGLSLTQDEAAQYCPGAVNIA